MSKTHTTEEIRNELNTTLEAILKGADVDCGLRDELKKRGFWERLFSNNTRDLAKSCMSATDLVENFVRVFDSFVLATNDKCACEKELIQIIDRLRQSEDKSIAKISNTIVKTVRATVKVDQKVKVIESRVKASEAAEWALQEICEACKAVNDISGEEFQRVLRTSLKRFCDGEVVLRNVDRKLILQGLKKLMLPDLDVDVGTGIERMSATEICEHELNSVVNEVDRYSSFRDELVGIIDGLTSQGSVVDPEGVHIDTLLDVRRKLCESEFKIALIGEFQGGKSTTFNALCGGREISPRGVRGGGVKTSAAVVTARNISDGRQKMGLSEWAEITWMSEGEILARIRDAVMPNRKKGEYSLVELHDAVGRRWNDVDRELSEEVSEEDIEIDRRIKESLEVASLQLKVLESGEYERYVSKTVVPITEFQSYVKFPEDWDTRWTKGIGAIEDFRIEDCLFACVDSVLVRLHSPILAKLGCSVTDCPGLFVNSWDTQRAMEVMRQSNAIWFLFDGEKVIRPDQLSVLTTIRKQGPEWVRKCFFTLNVRKPAEATSRILAGNVAKISGLGFGVENIYRYHALIAMRLQQLQTLRRGTLTKHDLEILAAESRKAEYSIADRKYHEESFDSARTRLLKASKAELRVVIRDHIRELACEIGYKAIVDATADVSDNEMGEIYESIGKMQTIISKLGSYVSEQKAVSILVDKGANECLRTVDALDGFRKVIEEDLDKKSSEAANVWKEAHDRLVQFSKHATEKFGFISDKNKGRELDEAFLEDFYLQNDEQICHETEMALVCLTKEEWKRPHLTSGAVEEAIGSKLSDKFMCIFSTYLERYLSTINGDNPTNTIYKERIFEPVRKTWAGLVNEWDALSKSCPTLAGIKLDPKIEALAISPWKVSFKQKFDLPVMFMESLRNALDWMGSKLLGFFGYKREDTDTRLEKEIKKSQVVKEAMADLKNSISDNEHFRAMFAEIRTEILKGINGKLKEARERYVKMDSEAARIREASAGRQEAAKKESEDVRKLIIEPKRRMIEAFRDRVLEAYTE